MPEFRAMSRSRVPRSLDQGAGDLLPQQIDRRVPEVGGSSKYP